MSANANGRRQLGTETEERELLLIPERGMLAACGACSRISIRGYNLLTTFKLSRGYQDPAPGNHRRATSCQGVKFRTSLASLMAMASPQVCLTDHAHPHRQPGILYIPALTCDDESPTGHNFQYGVSPERRDTLSRGG